MNKKKLYFFGIITTLSSPFFTVIACANANNRSGKIYVPSKIADFDITWTSREGLLLISPQITLGVTDIEKSFNAKDDIGKNLPLMFVWKKNGVAWTGKNFASEGIYEVEISHKNIKDSYKLIIKVSEIKLELDKFEDFSTSSKYIEEVRNFLSTLQVDDLVEIDQLGLKIDKNSNFEYLLRVKEIFNEDLQNIKFNLTIKQKEESEALAIKSLSKDINVAFNSSSILKDTFSKIENLDKNIANKPSIDLKKLNNKITWDQIGISRPNFNPAIKDDNLEIIENNIEQKNTLLVSISFRYEDREIKKQITILGDLRPWFILDTTTKIGGEKGVTAQITDKASGIIRIPYDSIFTKKEIENLLSVKDDVDASLFFLRNWYKDGQIVIGELNPKPTKDTFYTLMATTKDHLQQEGSYALVVVVEKEK